jgi:hypothetical protein
VGTRGRGARRGSEGTWRGRRGDRGRVGSGLEGTAGCRGGIFWRGRRRGRRSIGYKGWKKGVHRRIWVRAMIKLIVGVVRCEVDGEGKDGFVESNVATSVDAACGTIKAAISLVLGSITNEHARNRARC